MEINCNQLNAKQTLPRLLVTEPIMLLLVFCCMHVVLQRQMLILNMAK